VEQAAIRTPEQDRVGRHWHKQARACRACLRCSERGPDWLRLRVG
jgi:hypothetical protein